MLRRTGVILIIAILAVFLGLHFGLAPDGHDPRTVGTTAIGGVAFLLMTMSIMLSTRIQAAETLFGGLDRMYQVHKVSGVTAGVLVLAHFFGVPKELPVGTDPEVMALFPSAPLGMFALVLLVVSLAITLNRKIPYHQWRLPHKAMGLVYFLIIGHFMTAPSVFFERFNPSGLFLIGAACLGVLSYLYAMFGMNKKTGHNFTIEAINHLDRATEIVLSPVAGRFDFKPGQFAFVEVQAKGWNEPHPFTISSPPSESNLHFTIKVLGDWTRKIREELTVGGEVIVRGPYGRFDATAAGNRQVWLAGGIGITPFLSKLRAMKADDPREVVLVYGVREIGEALFHAELQSLSKKLPNFKLVTLQSNKGEFARVDIMKTRLGQPIASYDYFLCGPRPMVDGIMKDLRKAGVARHKLHSEAFEFR